MVARMSHAEQPNAEQVEYWNGPEGEHWVEHEVRFDAMLAPFVEPVLDGARVTEGTRVLDVGCGNGALARAAAARGASVVAVDISAPMIARARERAAAEGLGGVECVLGDAQVLRFAPEFDAVVSRFGVMFFTDPEAAFANLAGALRPGGRLAFVCWQDQFANEWIAVPGAALVGVVGPPDMPPPGAPGPFAFADADRVEAMLRAAGFGAVEVSGVRFPLLVGGGLGLDDTVAFLAGGGMGQRFLAGAGEEATARALAALREAFAPFVTPEGVRMQSAAWLVVAQR